MENKRYEYRTPLQIIVDHMLVKNGQSPEASKGYIRELSASGCRFESGLLLKAGQEILVSFVLPGGLVILNARLRVIRVLKKGRKKSVVAGQFVNLSEGDQYKIREFIVWKESQEVGKE